MTTINKKFLEFKDIGLDLRHAKFPCSDNDSQNNEYIIFLNVCKAFFCNFKIVCDLSLETLAIFVYENIKYTIKGVVQKCELHYDRFVINEHDENKSIIIEFGENARAIVAAVIRFDEQYYQRVSGYIDFEHRHDSAYRENTKMSKEERAEYDKKCEIKLLGYT
ncbi:AC57 [Trabala vishnou gigantina nucleopolyhedrovirus]|uniref:AC57 n=1 Tax=Trabala vishnou gigantina nucleopolyhedrovirus TaxID=2863583 RepID=UPI002481AE44|nr:AC57 [Trabala vishnou gigantina nucleopolyhedrovirus]QYC92747.1 AC57 [Trabala vishnou gigantina nucleopolyhedrovirus]